MDRRLGYLLTALAGVTVLVAALIWFDAAFYFKPPVAKLQQVWTRDIQLLESSKILPPQWNDVKEVSIKSDNSPAQDWISQLKKPLKTKPTGRYRLDVFFIHWIENNRYGVVVQHNLVDLTNTNTVWELNRTYKLGFIY